MNATRQPDPWRSRIVGESDDPPEQLLANPRNWRKHPGRQRDAMRGILREVGWVQRVVVNDRTGHVVDGHLRIEEAISAGAETVPVIHVDLSEEEERLVLATLDPLGALAGQSEDALQELLGELTVSDEGLLGLLRKLGHESGDAYSGSVIVPRFEPTGEAVEVRDLVDRTRTEALRHDLIDAPIPDDVRAFLYDAAARHLRFDYQRIAEFYATATPEVQRLIEASTLVIVDFEDAIRDGYIRFTNAIESLADEDDEEDEEES